MAVEKLRELAAWYEKNGEAVCGCGKADYPAPYGFCYTQKGNALYAYCMAQPMGDIILPELKGKVASIINLRTGDAGTCVDHWGFELLKSDDQRIRLRGIRPGDVMKLTLR